jgi:menaquinone-dependent protoporphyrinogen oxidase
MKTLIVYVSKQGCCEKSATMLLHGLGNEATMVELDADTRLDLKPYDTVIIGGPIYYGRLEGRVRRFCRRHMEALLQKRLGLFICCLETGEQADEELHEAFPPELLSHAVASGFFGGEIALERLNFVDRFMVRSIAKVEHNISTLSEERIMHFLEQLRT